MDLDLRFFGRHSVLSLGRDGVPLGSICIAFPRAGLVSLALANAAEGFLKNICVLGRVDFAPAPDGYALSHRVDLTRDEVELVALKLVAHAAPGAPVAPTRAGRLAASFDVKSSASGALAALRLEFSRNGVAERVFEAAGLASPAQLVRLAQAAPGTRDLDEETALIGEFGRLLGFRALRRGSGASLSCLAPLTLSPAEAEALRVFVAKAAA